MKRSSPPDRPTGFTLVEMLVVLAIIAILLVLTLPSLTGIKDANNITFAGYTVSGLLDQARTYALANNTYVWVGFFEEDGTRPSQQPAVAGNGGRLVISVVASQDGTRYDDTTINESLPAAFGAGDPSNPTNLVQVDKLVKINNMRMVAVNVASETGNNPARPAVAAAYQVGDPASAPPANATGAFALHVGAAASNPTTFTFPLNSSGSSAQYIFSKIIEFNPQGEASKIDENVFSGPGPQDAMEIALQPTHGGAIAPAYAGANQDKAAVAIQIEGLTGQVRTYRP